MKKIPFVVLSLLVVFVLACSSISLPFLPSTPEATETPEEDGPGSTSGSDLGGEPCEENEELTCVTIQVPLDHFDTSNTETLDVVFGILPASGERYGMYLQAFPGGPGGEGISSAYWSYFPEEVLEHFDIVYYDQRGIGLSSALECPLAYEKDFFSYLTEVNTAGLEGYDTPEEQQAAIDSSRTYVEECVAELGIDPAKLSFYGTDQVAEDIESFREFIGDEKFWLYGVSYGTAVGQTYAAAHPDRLNGLILDGTIDMTLTGEEGSLAQEKAFDKVLLATLNACNEDEDCQADMGGKDAVAVYDEFATRVSKDPIQYEYPLPGDQKVEGTFSFNMLEYTASYQMYWLIGRMMFLKAMAAANDGDLVPMLRLMYQNATIDPSTFEYIGDPTFSDTMFLSVLCTDDSFFDGTAQERVDQTIQAGQASNGTVPRLDGSVYTGLYCAHWPSSPQNAIQRKALVLEGVPTFVLNAKLDPATPFEQGKAVFDHLSDGYHIYVEGGVHGIYGGGYDCPDQYVNDFLLDGTLPSEHEIVCEDWGADAVEKYIPNLPGSASEIDDPMEFFQLVDQNFYYLPEYYLGDVEEQFTTGCTYGGTYSYAPGDSGETHTYTDCSMVPGIVMTGEGLYDIDAGTFTITAVISGDKQGEIIYKIDFNTFLITLTGEFDGETLDLEKQY
jgi:pimeloyl-ACP methyl ester carboxylesterase